MHARGPAPYMHVEPKKKTEQNSNVFVSFSGYWGQTEMKREVSCWVRANFAHFFFVVIIFNEFGFNAAWTKRRMHRWDLSAKNSGLEAG